VTTKRIGKSILEKTLTRWPVFVDHFILDAVIQYLNENAFLGECFDSILNQVIFFLSAGWTLSPEGRVSTG
ncbi:hypothetical protein RNO00_16655, partial [Escherichia coli]|nr:hypothetical protein [Escherichia coli]